jgi:hypothetical protein
MHCLCRFAQFPSSFVIFLLLILSTSTLRQNALAEGRPSADFPPEVDYPEEAYDSDDNDADGQKTSENPEYLRPKDLRDKKDGKKRALRDRNKKVERSSIPDSEPSSTNHSAWRTSVEFGSGLNNVIPTIDPYRETVGLVQSLLFDGKFSVYRNAWGFEFLGQHANTPIQEVEYQDPDTAAVVKENRALRSFAALAGLNYRQGLAGPTGRFFLIARLGWGALGITQEIETTSGITNHHAQANGLYLGAGLEARWTRYLISSFDFYQSMIGSGRLGPEDAPVGSSGFGYLRFSIVNRLRLATWGENSGFGVGFHFNMLKLTTPQPPAADFVGGKETLIQSLGTGYLEF